MAQKAQKLKAAGNVATIAVSLDEEKTALAGYAQGLGKDWTILCDYKGYESRAAKDYGIKHVPSTIILDNRGRIRLSDSLSWLSEEYVEDLQIESFWLKKRAAAAAGPPAPASPSTPQAPPPPPPPAAEVQWIFHLKSGGKIKVISYEEKDGKYVLKLPTGSSTVAKEDVERIAKP